jgi:hypothetical protein
MSSFPAIVAQIARAAHEAAATFEAFPGMHVMSLSSPSDLHRIPLSLRPSHELRSRAAELARMATTATTADARTALETLATRFAELAAKREIAEALELNDADLNNAASGRSER